MTPGLCKVWLRLTRRGNRGRVIAISVRLLDDEWWTTMVRSLSWLRHERLLASSVLSKAGTLCLWTKALKSQGTVDSSVAAAVDFHRAALLCEVCNPRREASKRRESYSSSTDSMFFWLEKKKIRPSRHTSKTEPELRAAKRRLSSRRSYFLASNLERHAAQTIFGKNFLPLNRLMLAKILFRLCTCHTVVYVKGLRPSYFFSTGKLSRGTLSL